MSDEPDVSSAASVPGLCRMVLYRPQEGAPEWAAIVVAGNEHLTELPQFGGLSPTEQASIPKDMLMVSTFNRQNGQWQPYLAMQQTRPGAAGWRWPDRQPSGLTVVRH